MTEPLKAHVWFDKYDKRDTPWVVQFDGTLIARSFEAWPAAIDHALTIVGLSIERAKQPDCQSQHPVNGYWRQCQLVAGHSPSRMHVVEDPIGGGFNNIYEWRDT